MANGWEISNRNKLLPRKMRGRSHKIMTFTSSRKTIDIYHTLVPFAQLHDAMTEAAYVSSR